MDNLITCEIRFAEDDTRQSPGLLVGTLLTYGEIASDRRELFDDGALTFPPGGLWITEQHNRDAPIMRAMPVAEGRAMVIRQPFPDTVRGRDAATGMRMDPPLYTGLSVDFHSRRETRRAGLRVIQAAYVPRAGLVDLPSYSGSTAEVREQASGPYWKLDRGMLRWL